MEFYGGIDVSARTSVICVIDEQLKILVKERVPNNVGEIVAVLKPYRGSLQIVVESTLTGIGSSTDCKPKDSRSFWHIRSASP